MREGLLADQDPIVHKYPDAQNLHDLENLLHLDQRLPNYACTEREYNPGDFAWLENPYLDNDALDFIKKVPTRLRFSKALYLQTISAMMPELFSIPRSVEDERDPDYVGEFSAHRGQLEQLVNTRPSILDSIVPPERIIDFMRAGLQEKPTDVSTTRFLKSLIPHDLKLLIWRIGKMGRENSRASAIRPLHVKHNPRVQVLRRALALRSFLNKTVDRNLLNQKKATRACGLRCD